MESKEYCVHCDRRIQWNSARRKWQHRSPGNFGHDPKPINKSELASLKHWQDSAVIVFARWGKCHKALPEEYKAKWGSDKSKAVLDFIKSKT